MVKDLFVNIGEDFTISFGYKEPHDSFVCYISNDAYQPATSTLVDPKLVGAESYQFTHRIEADGLIYRPRFYRIDCIHDGQVKVISSGRIFINPTALPNQ